MTPRGCVLGNSHAACLREAWGREPHPGFALEFVAAHAEKLDGLEIARGKAVARTDELRETLKRLGMRRSFRLDEFDFFVVTACQVSIFRAVHAARAVAVWPDDPGERPLVSTPCLRELLVDSLQDTTAYRLAVALRDGSDVPIIVLPTPRPHAAVLFPESRHTGFGVLARAGRGPWLSGLYESACERALHGVATVLHQPSETVIRDLCTAPAYCEGSIMLAIGRRTHKPDDILHANEAYGALQVAQIAGALGLASPGQPGAT